MTSQCGTSFSKYRNGSLCYMRRDPGPGRFINEQCHPVMTWQGLNTQWQTWSRENWILILVLPQTSQVSLGKSAFSFAKEGKWTISLTPSTSQALAQQNKLLLSPKPVTHLPVQGQTAPGSVDASCVCPRILTDILRVLPTRKAV